MISVSNKWKTYAESSSVYHIRGTLGLISLSDEDFMEGSISIEDAVSSDSDFNLGSVVTNVFKGTLNNYTEKFDITQLEGKTLTIEIGIEYTDGTSEYIQKGVYRVERPITMNDAVQITAYDNMDKFNSYIDSYSFAGKTCYAVVSDFCDTIGVGLAGHFPNDTHVLPEIELANTATFRQILSYIAQICGCIARANNEGELELKALTIPDSDIPELPNYQALSIEMSDVEITSVNVRACNANENIEYTAGTNGKTLSLADNPFVTTAAQCQTIANRILGMYGGMTFRPFECTAFGNPAYEAGDAVQLPYKDEEYASIITSYSFCLGNFSTIICGSDSSNVDMVSESDMLTKFAVDQAYKVLQINGLIADWIRGGTLKIGGSGFTADGKIEVYDPSDNLIASITKNGVTINQGDFNVYAEDPDEQKVIIQKTTEQDEEYRTAIAPKDIFITDTEDIFGDATYYEADYSAREFYLIKSGGDLDSPIKMRLSAEALLFLIGNSETINIRNDGSAIFKAMQVEAWKLKGSANKPVYFNGSGQPVACTNNIPAINFDNQNFTSVTCPNATNTTLGSITLPAGKYILTLEVRYASNANGYRSAWFSETQAGSAVDNPHSNSVAAVNGTYTRVHLPIVENLTAQKTYYIVGYQTSGSSLAMLGWLRYFKIT